MFRGLEGTPQGLPETEIYTLFREMGLRQGVGRNFTYEHRHCSQLRRLGPETPFVMLGKKIN